MDRVCHQCKEDVLTKRPAEKYHQRELFRAVLHHEHAHCLQYLITSGADVNEPCFYGQTPLMYAAKYGRTRQITLLITSGADVNIKDKNGQTALSLAAQNGCVNSIEVLTSAGADVNSKDEDGQTALSTAVAYGHIECVKRLISSRSRCKHSHNAFPHYSFDTGCPV